MQTLEGTWEEIQKYGDRLVGRKVRLTVMDGNGSETALKNENMLAAISKTRALLVSMRYTSGSESQDLLRAAREGGMFAE